MTTTTTTALPAQRDRHEMDPTGRARHRLPTTDVDVLLRDTLVLTTTGQLPPHGRRCADAWCTTRYTTDTGRVAIGGRR